jgi:hypothetical protein
MSQRLFSILYAGAIAFSMAIPGVQAQFAPRAQAAPKATDDGTLNIVMVDQAQLSATQKEAFQRFLQTANLPHTKVGKSCQYYGKPQIWCLLLDPPIADQVYQQISRQSFGSAASIKPVRRLRAPEKS